MRTATPVNPIVNFREFSMARLLLVVLTWPLLGAVGSSPDVPRLTGHVNDLAAILSAGARKDLEGTLVRYEAETTHQIAVLTVATLGGEPIDQFSLRVAKTWRLGRQRFDNGVLLTIAPAEHRVRIELGDGMARFVSNAQAGAIIASMTPDFRSGDYDSGVRLGLDELMQACRAYRVDHRVPATTVGQRLVAGIPDMGASRSIARPDR
jgi:uncharacterized protein